MAELNAKEWLEGWVDENLQVPQYHEDKSQMASGAVACREAAKVAGISTAALNEAAGGDLAAYLLRAQNQLTDAAVRGKVESDKY